MILTRKAIIQLLFH